MTSEDHAKLAEVMEMKSTKADTDRAALLFIGLAQYHATMAVYGLLTEVVEGFRTMGLVR